MVSDWPGRKVKAEPEIVPGYEYKESAPVTLAIGGDKFNFFARNDGQERQRLAAVAERQSAPDRRHEQGRVGGGAGTSARGTKTIDTYSLAGFNDALAKIHAACNM